MSETENRNLGVQPIEEVLKQNDISHHDIVASSPTPISHKMVARAVKGRKLTPHSQKRILEAINAIGETTWQMHELFNYGPHTRKKQNTPQ